MDVVDEVKQLNERMDKMLKLQYCQSVKHNHWYWKFVDEFSKKDCSLRAFETLNDAVNYANKHISYNGECFDLYSINKPIFDIVDLDKQ